jgi:uncharacterized protein YlxW (UPF0749 family)
MIDFSRASMIDEVAASIPIWIFLSICLGFLMGEAVGDSRRHRKCLEEANDDLRDQLKNDRACVEPLHQAIKQQRGVINDIHKHVVALSKALRNRSSSK